MEPLSITAIATAVIAKALRSAKATRNLVDGLPDAPRTITECGSLLYQIETALSTLERTLEANSESPTDLVSLIQEIELLKALKWINLVCQRLEAAVTRHSPDSVFTTRHSTVELRINTLKRDLVDCQATMTIVVSAITLYDSRL
jgi:predicted ATP-binding protein involved in virulence